MKCDVLLVHSNNDEVIPVSQSYMLMEKFYSNGLFENGNYLKFIELAKIGHNDMHQYFVTEQ